MVFNKQVVNQNRITNNRYNLTLFKIMNNSKKMNNNRNK